MVRIFDNLVLIVGCGGQDLFMEQFFQSHRKKVLKNFQVLIYVFDVISKDFNGELQYYKNCLNTLTHQSHYGKIFCFMHKIDLLAEGMREKMFMEKVMKIKDKIRGFAVDCL